MRTKLRMIFRLHCVFNRKVEIIYTERKFMIFMTIIK